MKNARMFFTVVFSLFVIVCAEFSLSAQSDNRTVINIENAQNTRYEKDKQTGNDVIILSGNVKISVTKGSNKNVITADVIRYDRVTEMLYADGTVSLEQTTANSGSQNVTANALMFNTSTLEGVFDDGRVVQTKSDAINLPSGSTLIVASDIFGRSESNTIAFKDGVLTFCDDEDPHWNIKASRIWLLPGGEFAFLNALLFVGPVPVFYFPAFYYPKDELIFNPVFGYRKREGYFIQTTAYVYGRKPLDSTSSSASSSTESDGSEKLKALFNFIKPSSLKEQRIEGLMLHNLDEDYTGNTTNYFKIMGDYYTNLGIMVGADGVFKPQKYISDIEFGMRLGFSNTVFRNGTDYLPYGVTGTKYHDRSNLLGLSLPFRYATNFKMSMSKPFSLSLTLPIYSDPYFTDDFSERSETMDWISYLIDSANDDDDDDTINEISSFSWTLNSSYSVPIPEILKPVVSTLSVSLNSSIAFSTKNTTDFSADDIESEDVSAWQSSSPQRKFYYPSQITPFTFNGTLSGTIVDYSSTRTKSSKKVNTPSFASPLVLPEEFRTDAEKKAAAEAADGAAEIPADDAENSGADSSEEAEAQPEESGLVFLSSEPLPSLSSSTDSASLIPGIAFSMKYSVKPSISTQIAYSSENLKKADDFDWSNLRSSMYTIKVPVTLDNSFSYAGSFFSISNSYTFNPVFQKHPYISDDVESGGYTESQITSLKKTDYSAEKRDLTNTNSVSLKPFYYISAIKDTGITWRSSIKMIRTEFLADQYDAEKDEPEWKYHWVDWGDEESITTNALDFTFASNQMDNKFTQSFTLSTTLKPQAEAYYGTLKFGFPYTTLAFEAGVKKSSTEDDAEWVKQPFKQSLTLSLFNNTLKFSESYNYNMEESYHDSMKLSLSWKSLSVAYTMSYTNGYDFSDGTDGPRGWNMRADKEFLPYSLSFSYSPSTKTVYTWKNRISLGLGLSTSIVADLLRPTSSYFTFSPSVSFKIHEFLTFTFSSTSRNSVIYRYFGNDIGLSGEENIFKDLLNSFRFDDDSLREASGFKLKSLNFTATHELHDWDFSMSFKMEPRLITEDGKRSYDFSPYITISILWRPMSAMKTEIIDDYGEWRLQ